MPSSFFARKARVIDEAASYRTPGGTAAKLAGEDAATSVGKDPITGPFFPLPFERETLILAQSMRILVQDAVRKVFFDGADWNENPAQAKEFESVAHAESFCQKQELSSALIVVKSKDDSHDISYPVGVRNALLVSKPPTTRIRSLC
jgi:hypothetical protein